MSQLLAQDSASPAKGWVRDGILSFLAKRPGTATEIARELGVSKATVSYHTKALIRRGMIEIADVKSIRGGVYSKTYALKQGALPLARRRNDQEGSLTKLDEWFERLLMSMHLEPKLRPAEDLEIFLYHIYSLLAESDSLEEGVFEDFGRRVGDGIIAPSLKFNTFVNGLRELCQYLASEGIANVTSELRKGSEPRLSCTECLDNREHGSLVCSFTKGMLTGAIKAKDGGTLRLERSGRADKTGSCVYVVKRRGFKK